MNRIMYLLFICVLAIPSYAQQALNLEVQQPDPSAAEWELSLSLTISPDTSPGFFVQLPEGVRFIPTRVQTDGTSLWLLNAEQQPQQDSVVCWFEQDGGLMIIFRENEIPEGSQISVSGMLMLMKDQLLPQEIFQIKTISITGGILSLTDQIIEEAGIPSPLIK